jgi:muramidase (phage lysozyme)
MTPTELRKVCFDALGSQSLRAFLAVIRAGEGTSDPDGYRRHYGGTLFDSFADHPCKAITAGRWTSTAAGAYQFLMGTWRECAAALALPDFSPASQDLAAVFLIRRRGALPDALAGRLDAAIAKCAKEWASLPGSPYGQPTRTLAQAHAVYAQAGGTLAGDTDTDTASPEPVMPIPAIVAALLPVLTSAVPELVKLIKPDSEPAEKNAAVAVKVFEVAKTALDATNEQEVAERIQADPQAAQTVRQAVQDRWYELAEVGGGVQAARAADIEYVEKVGGFWRSPSFAAMFFLAPLVYMIVGSISGLWGFDGWSPDVRASIATAVVSLVVGGAAGFYWGSTTGSNKPAAAKRA